MSSRSCYFAYKKAAGNSSRIAGRRSGAGGGGRTRTRLPATDFESVSSANSNTPARFLERGLVYYICR